MSTALSNIRQTFHMNLAVTTVALVQTDHECCTCYLTLYVVISTSEWTAPLEYVYVLLCCVILAELGQIPFNLELTFTFFPSQ